MTKSEVLQFFEEHKEDVEVVKEHGDGMAKLFAQAIEKVALDESNGEYNITLGIKGE